MTITRTKSALVRAHVLSELEGGRLCGGGRLPGARELADALGVSLLTVQNVLATLVKEGVLRVIPRRGTYVDSEVASRVLQSNASCYIPWEQLPWGEEFRRRCNEQLPQLHFSNLMKNSVFEICATPKTQARSDEYLDLAPIFHRLWPDTKDFFQPQLHTFSRGEKIFGIPVLFSPRVIFVNMGMFRAAGVSLPRPDWNWDDFFDTIVRLRGKLPGDQVFSWSTDIYLWINFVLRSGGGLLDPNLSDPVLLDSAATLRGLQRFRKLRTVLGYQQGQKDRHFWHGKVALAVAARQAVGRIKLNGWNDWNIVPLPANEDERETKSMQATELFCVRRSCVDLSMAEKILKLLLAPDFQDYIAKLKYAIPLRRSAAEKSFDVNDPRDQIFRQELLRTQSQYHLNSPELFSVVTKGVAQLLMQDRELEGGLSDMGNMLRTYLKIVNDK
jgi:hypothetical protein